MLINFFGKRGAGKTTAIAGQLNDCRAPVVVLDILGNFSDVGDVKTTNAKDTILWIKKIVEDPNEENEIIVFQCADPDLAIDYISSALWEAGGGTLVIDEADGFSLAQAPCFDQLVRYGRNRNVDIITGCRRPAEISRNITAGANQLFAFQTQEPRDIDYFRSTVFGDRAEQLISVPKYSGLFIDYDKSQIGRFRIDENGRIYKFEVSSTESNQTNLGNENEVNQENVNQKDLRPNKPVSRKETQ